MTTNELTERIIGAAIWVHRELGPGLLESTYEACLAALLVREGIAFQRQALMPLVFLGERLESAYRVDMIVDGRVIVELKAVARLEPVHTAQVLTYLKLSGCQVGLLLNFNVPILSNGGIKRLVLGYQDELR